MRIHKYLPPALLSLILTTTFVCFAAGETNIINKLDRELYTWQSICYQWKHQISSKQAYCLPLQFQRICKEVTLDLSKELTQKDIIRIQKMCTNIRLHDCTKMLEKNYEKSKTVFPNANFRQYAGMTLCEFFLNQKKTCPSVLWYFDDNFNNNENKLIIWHALCQNIDKTCSFNTACALILKHIDKCIHPVNTASSNESSSSSSSSYGTPLSNYCQELTQFGKKLSRSVAPRKNTSDYNLKKTIDEATMASLYIYAMLNDNKVAKPNKNYAQAFESYLDKIKMGGAAKIIHHPTVNSTISKTIMENCPTKLKEIIPKIGNPICDHKDTQLIFLHGESGVGKTILGQIIAEKTKRPLLYIDCSTIQSLKNILKPLTNNTEDPWIVLLDEIDSLKNNFTSLQLIMDKNTNQNLTVIATTSYINSIPESVRRRAYQTLIDIPLPNLADRKKILSAHFKANNLTCSETTLNYLAWRSGGWLSFTSGISSRDLEQIVCNIKNLKLDQITESDGMRYKTKSQQQYILKNKTLDISFWLAQKGISSIVSNLKQGGSPL